MATEQQHTIAAQLAALPNLPMTDLWALWDQHFPRRPSHRNRNYVESRLAYRIQELAYGRFPMRRRCLTGTPIFCARMNGCGKRTVYCARRGKY